ncbi:MAG: flavin reductase family protein [Myxococcota bacterium]
MPDLTDSYREVMSHWPSGVAIVTSGMNGSFHGMTVSSFTSVSLHPPMVSICVDKRAQMCNILKASQKFAVNLLQHSQKDLAASFADHRLSMVQRFEQAEFSADLAGNPILAGALAWLDCRISGMHDTGDHVIYLGEVLRASVSGAGEPLIYYRRGWHRIA